MKIPSKFIFLEHGEGSYYENAKVEPGMLCIFNKTYDSRTLRYKFYGMSCTKVFSTGSLYYGFSIECIQKLVNDKKIIILESIKVEM